MPKRRTKEETARELAKCHFLLDSSLTKIYRIRSLHEEEADEPIKLLEVTPNTSETGTVDAFLFTPDEDIEYWTVIAEVSPNELKLIHKKEMDLPEGWDLSGADEFSRSDILAEEGTRA